MARDDRAGKDRDTKDTTSAADRASSGKTGGTGRAGGVGTAGVGGGFSSSPSSSSGKTGGTGRAGGVGSPGVGGGFDGNSSSSGKSGGGGGANLAGSVGSYTGAQKSGGQNLAGSVGSYTSATRDIDDGASMAGSVGSYTSANRGLMSAANTPPASMENSYRLAEIQSMDALGAYGKEVVSVIEAGKGWTTVELRDGTVERRSGTRASRNNNPGNIEFGDYAKAKGAVGDDGRFAVFSTPQQGRKAIGDLVFSNSGKYANKTIEGAIGVYAPDSENDTKAYAAHVAAAAGVTVDTPTTSLTDVQKDAMVEAMTVVEGGRPYDTSVETAGRWGTEGYNSSAPATATAGTTIDLDGPATPDFANISKQESIERQYAYAGMSRSLAPAVGPTQRFRDTYISPAYTAEEQGLPPGTPGTRAIQSQIASTVSQPGPGTTVAPTVTSGTPVAPTTTPGAAVSPIETDKAGIQPNRQRGTGAQIVAGGIDVLAGLTPGVGIAASIFNGGASLLGNRTIGERMVDGFLSGEDDGGTGRARESDSMLVRDDPSATEADAAPTATTAEEAPVKDKNRFVRMYLTPAEKWGSAKGLMTAAA